MQSVARIIFAIVFSTTCDRWFVWSWIVCRQPSATCTSSRSQRTAVPYKTHRDSIPHFTDARRRIRQEKRRSAFVEEVEIAFDASVKLLKTMMLIQRKWPSPWAMKTRKSVKIRAPSDYDYFIPHFSRVVHIFTYFWLIAHSFYLAFFFFSSVKPTVLIALRVRW